MKNIFLLILIFSICALSQQVNYTWGTNTIGNAYTQTGASSLDSSSTVSIVFDMQDYYFSDPHPLVSDTSGAVVLSSSRMYFGTLWFRLDAENAADSSNFWIGAKAGNMIYHPNDNSRVTATNINWSTTYTAIADTTRQKGDIQWRPYNIYLDFSGISQYKFMPPEFIGVDVKFGNLAADSMAIYWNYVYLAVPESEQQDRSTTRSNASSKKSTETMH